MALAKIKKIQLIASKNHKTKILDLLQDAGTLEINELNDEEKAEAIDLATLQKTELTYANLDFAIKLLGKFGKKKGLFAQPKTLNLRQVESTVKNFDYQKIIDNCLDLEEKIVRSKNAVATADHEINNLSAWKNMNPDLDDLSGTVKTRIILGSVKINNFETFIQKLHKPSNLISSETVSRDKVDAYLMIIFERELEKEIRQILNESKFQEADLPGYKGTVKEYIGTLKERIRDQNKVITESEAALRELARHLEDLEITNDYFGWQLEKLETEKKIANTDYNFILNGWIPEKNLQKLEKDLEKITKEYSIDEIALKEGEEPPVIISNNNFISPFEAVSRIYGLPKSNELDPTPFLAAYFIIFFALCLTDAGYGLLMFVSMGLILKFFKLSDGIKKLVKLLMYGGVMTFFIGALFGGWFGLTPDQVPESLTYTAANGEKMFIFQKINAIAEPITVLILALSLGFLQILMGVTMKFVHGLKENKKEAVLDNGTWVFMLTGIGLFILATALNLSPVLQAIAKWWVILATVILILTQGRDKKNIFAKLISGILSLYGLVGYMSDILSYSRLLALGLATTIIGLAVNIVAELVLGLPYIGWLLVVVVFIGGHLFNLLINALGSFIHSGRLQFVEFFTKFMEGGGAEFKPFSKKTKYIFITK